MNSRFDGQIVLVTGATGLIGSNLVKKLISDNAKVIAMCLIDEPQGIYYGGTIAAPVIRELFENILPYLEIQNN